MKTTHKKIITLVTALVMVIVGFVSLTGCTSQQQTNLIRIDGAFALQPMMIKWTDEYHKLHPNVTFDVQASGAGVGMNLMLARQIDLAMLSRAINNSEVTKGAVYVSVARDAVFATINSQNPVINQIMAKGVTKKELRLIFINGTITTWGQLVGNPNITTPINIYTRGDAGCGAADTFAKYLGNYKQGNLSKHAKNAPTGDVEMAQDIVADPDGIGYNNMAYIYDANGNFQYNGSLRPIPLDLNSDGILNTTENFYNNRVALQNAINTNFLPAPPARVENLAVYHNFSGPVKAFVLWILNASGGQQYVSSTGYVALPADIIQQQITYIETGIRPQ
ncbi:MAG TPA: PstS family phosphate ABC transporter substrate-binding protein [Candidatus Thermoplasmatota archaeon]|nr:PstS family phosphate ABC transporter substrate-binding protein [Candidatus Thermoplasmatota archaeon]